MKQPDSLFSLIKGLTKTEKRYFKRHSLIYGSGESNYINLFNAIEKQKTYNEAEVKKQFKGQVFVKQFSVTKNYLFHLVLKSMELYHQNTHIEVHIRSMINRVNLLFDKTMYRECDKWLDKAQHLAQNYEMHNLILEMIRLRRKVKVKLGDLKAREKINEEEFKIISLVQNTNEMQILKDKIYFQYVTIGVGKKQEAFMRHSLKHPLLKNENDAKTFLAKYLFLESHFICYTSLAENEKMFQCSKKIVNLYLAHPVLLEYYNSNYLLVLNNFLYSCDAVGNVNELKYGVDLLIQAKKYVRSENDKIQFFYFQDNVVHYYNTIGDFDKAMKYCQDNLIPVWEIYKDRGDPLWKGELVTYIATSYFGKGEYHNALKWLNKVYQEIKIKDFPDVVLFGYMFYIIVHFELKNYDLLPSLLQSIKHLSRKMEKVNPFYTLLFRFFQRFPLPHVSPAEMKDIYSEMKKEIKDLNLDSFESEFQKRFDYLSWIESKIENKPFAEIVRKKALQ